MKMKKLWITTLSLCAALCFATGCGGNKEPAGSSPTESTPAENILYSFEVKATEGTDLFAAGLKIAVYKNGEKLTSMGVDNSGKRTKTLPADEYEVRLENANGETLYSTKTTKNADEAVELYYAFTPNAGAGEEYNHYQVAQGYYSAPLTQEGETYFSFKPTEAGTYRISSFGEADVLFRLYEGSDSFLNPTPADFADDKSENNLNFVYNFQVTPAEITNADGSFNNDFRTIFSVGYSDKAEMRTATACIIAIEYVSDDYDTDPLVQTVVLTKADPVLYNENDEVVPFGAQSGTLTPVPYNATFVYNETDRYYHLENENGPLVVMPFTVTPERLLDQPFNKIGNPDPNDPSDNATPATLHLTFVNPETGEKTVKEYNKLINEIYPSAVNADGVYPLTQEMYEFVYQFVMVAQNDINVENIPAELRWKAPFYYYATEEITDNKPDVSGWTGDVPTGGNGLIASPYTIIDGEYCAAFGSVSGVVYYSYTAQADGVITIATETAKSNLYLLRTNSFFSETTELLGNGTMEINVQKGDTLLIQICASDWEPLTIVFSITYCESEENFSVGTMENPYVLTVGATTVQGLNDVWYAFTPIQSGTYTFSTENTNSILSLYSSASTSALIKNSMNSNYGGIGAGFSVALQAGTTYYLQVSELSFESFTLVLNVKLN